VAKLLKLIQNEWLKLWSKKGTWAMVILLAVMIIGLSGLNRYMDTQNDNDSWTTSLEDEQTQIEAELSKPDLTEDEKVELIQRQEDVQENIIFSIEQSEPQNREKVIVDTYGMMSLVLLLTIIAAAGIVASEFSQGTIKMLLSRPVKRWKILTSKYLIIILFGLLLTVVTYLFSVISAYIFFPAAEGNSILFNGSEVAIASVFSKSVYLMLLTFVFVCVMATLAFMISTVFKSSALAIGVSLFLYFTGSLMVMFLEDYAIAKYLLFAHDLAQYEMGFKMLDTNTMPFSIVVLAGYFVVFLVISYTTFIKRDITA